MSLIKRLFVFSLVVTTVLWSFGGLSVKAAGSYGAGSLLALEGVEGSAVYYIGSDDKKYVFPDPKTYATWYDNFDAVVRVSVSELDMYADGGAMTYRAGTKLVTHANTAKIYAVGPGGMLHWIPTAEIAAALYGDMWYMRVLDAIPGYFSSSYVSGADLSDMYPSGTLLQMGSDMYYVDGTDVRVFADADAFDANNFDYDNLIEVDNVDAYGTGESITGEESGLSGFMPAEGTNDDVVVVDGDLSVSLSSTTPAQGYIPYNVQGYVYTTLKLMAGDSDVDVTGLTIERTGLGDYNDFSYVYVEVDGLRHGTKRTLGSDNEAEISFATASNKITVPANGSVMVDIVADMGSTTADAGHFNALVVTDITTGADLSASLPLAGNHMTINSIGVATATVSFNGSDGTNVEIGENQVEVGAVKITNTSSAEDISFESIVLENTGSADAAEASNYTLYDESDTVVAGPVNATAGDYINFVLDEAFVIQDSKSEDFVVKADINKGRTETIILSLEEVTDFNATGLTNGYAVTASEAVGSVDDTYTIIGGDLVINEADTNPSSQDVAPQSDDVTFLIADLEALEETAVVTSSTLTLTCPSADNCADLENITAYLDGSVVFGPVDGTDGGLTIAFTEDFEIDGAQEFTVEADIGENASGTYSISLASNNAFTAESSEGDALDSISGSATGNSVVVGVSGGTLSVDGTYGSQNMVAGDEDFLIGQFVLEASDYEGIIISSYKPHLTLGTIALTDIDKLWISEDDESDAITSNLTATSTFSVSSQELAAGETKVIKVYATVDSDYAGAGTIQVDEMAVETEGMVSEDETTVYLTGTAQTITVTTGTLTLALGADTPEEMTVLAGNTYEVAEYNFAAANVGYTINEVTIEAHNSNTTNTSAVVAATLGGVAGTVINGVLTFDTDIYVEKDEDLDVVLSATFNDSFNNIASGDAMEFAIVGYKYTGDNDTSETTAVDYESTAELMHVRASDVTVSTAANATTLGATTKIMDITFTADTAGDVTINTSSFAFNFHDDTVVQGSSLTITNIYLKDSSGTTLASDTTDYNADDNAAFTSTLTGIAKTIGAGASKTYTLSITVTNYATDDYINVTMLKDTSTTSTYFGWRDEEATADISGFLVDELEEDTYEATR